MAQASFTLADILTMVAEITDKITDYASGSNATLKAAFTRGINEGYRKIVKEKYKLDYSESITLDSSRCFNPTTLTKSVFQIKQIVDTITDSYGYTFMELQRDKIFVPEATPSKAVLVCYYYLPDDLALDASVPEIPAAIIPKDVYARYAAFYYFSDKKRFNEANYHYTLYENAMMEAFTNRTPRKLLVRKMR
jgi:hypothetical protein